ncbi:hypothetical protein MMC31_004530 [Peltigera leucophlebia]|nr:hypothetical protein [Peltigera leucophlebia]
MSSESEGTCTRRENKDKRKAELEALNQQDNEEQQTRKSRQIREAKQPKFKSSFTPEMKKSLGIDDQDFRSLLRDPSCKRGTKQLEQESSNVQGANKKGKKLSGGEQIAIEMNRWTLQNATALEQRRLKKMTEEVRAMEDIRVYYTEAIADLTLQEFNVLVCGMQKRGDEYGGYTAGQYYLLLARSPFCDQFMETFLQVIQDREHIE